MGRPVRGTDGVGGATDEIRAALQHASVDTARSQLKMFLEEFGHRSPRSITRVQAAKTDAGNRQVDLSLDVIEELMAWRAERQPAE